MGAVQARPDRMLSDRQRRTAGGAVAADDEAISGKWDMSTTTITAPGVYLDMPKEAYHGKPTPTFALSAGFIKTMQDGDQGPAAAWYDSAMRPDYKWAHSENFDIGEAAHILFLEEPRFEASISVVDADSWRGKDAKAARQRAYDRGLVPLLPQHLEKVLAMRRAFHNAIPGLPFSTAPDFAARGLSGGNPEASIFAFDEEFGIWMKARPDYIRQGAQIDTLVDYKTMSLGALDIRRYAQNMGWKQRSAWYTEVYRKATGRDCEYYYLGQVKEEPYFCKCYQMSDRATTWGHRLNQVAKRDFAEYMSSGRWPSNVDHAEVIDLTDWDERMLQDREAEGYFKGRPPLDRKLSKIVQDAYAP